MKLLRTTLLVTAAMLPFSAQAGTIKSSGTSRIVPYVGYTNPFENGNSDNAAQFGAEYRYGGLQWAWIQPTLGANFDTDGAMYGYAGFNFDLNLNNRWFITPSIAVGAYHSGGGKDLGGVIEFRSGIELGYQFENLHRVGVALTHVSNASIYDKNPGDETLLINYSIPLSTFH